MVRTPLNPSGSADLLVEMTPYLGRSRNPERGGARRSAEPEGFSKW